MQLEQIRKKQQQTKRYGATWCMGLPDV